MATLSGMKEICDYEKKSEPTVLALIRDFGYPARKLKGVWMSDTELVAEWRVEFILGKGEAVRL